MQSLSAANLTLARSLASCVYVCIRYIVYFNNLWHKFEEIDSDHDRRINAEEFSSGCSIIGLELSPEEAAAEFKKCDADGGGQILFIEFCAWCAERHIASDD